MRSLRWRSVTGGIIAAITLTLAVVLILRYAKTGGLHGARFKLYVATSDAYNLLRGSEVWLNGQRIGIVRSIAFNRPTADAGARVIIETDILSEVQPLIRFDSRAELRSGGTIIGAPVVYIRAGTMNARAVVAGDTIRAAGNPDLELAAARITESAEQLPQLLDNGRAILADVRATRARMTEVAGVAPRGARFAASARELFARLSGGPVGKAGRDSVTRRRMMRALAALDSLHLLLQTRTASVGRFRRDSSLATSVRELRAEVDSLRLVAAAPAGSIGRAQVDSSLTRSLDSAFAELSALLADVKAHPLRYAHVF